MQIDFSHDELVLLRGQLDRLVEEMERELVRTDKADLQHALNRDFKLLVAIRDRIATATSGARLTPAPVAR